MSPDLSKFADVGSVISETDLKNHRFDRIDRLFAESSDSKGHLRRGGAYAVYYHKGSYSHVKYAYQTMLLQIKNMGYEPTGDAYEEYLIAEAATKHKGDYVTKIMIQVEKMK